MNNLFRVCCLLVSQLNYLRNRCEVAETTPTETSATPRDAKKKLPSNPVYPVTRAHTHARVQTNTYNDDDGDDEGHEREDDDGGGDNNGDGWVLLQLVTSRGRRFSWFLVLCERQHVAFKDPRSSENVSSPQLFPI